MTYKGARHGYVFEDDISDLNRKYRIKLKKKSIARTKESVKANTSFFNEKEKLLNYIPHQDESFKKYIRAQEIDTVGKIKLPWDR